MDKNNILQIVIKGTGEQVPLLAVADIFKEFHYIIDKSYLSITGKNKISRTDRELYKILANNIKSGSVKAELLIALPPLIQSAFDFHKTGLTVENLWELTKNSFKFLKFFTTAKNEGKKTTIYQDNNPFSFNIANLGDGNVNINIGKFVLENASRSESHMKSLAKVVDDKNISNFSALDQTNDGIILTPKENKLFNPETVIDDTHMNLSEKYLGLI